MGEEETQDWPSVTAADGMYTDCTSSGGITSRFRLATVHCTRAFRFVICTRIQYFLEFRVEIIALVRCMYVELSIEMSIVINLRRKRSSSLPVFFFSLFCFVIVNEILFQQLHGFMSQNIFGCIFEFLYFEKLLSAHNFVVYGGNVFCVKFYEHHQFNQRCNTQSYKKLDCQSCKARPVTI